MAAEITESKIQSKVETEPVMEEKPKFQWKVVDNHSPPEVYNWRLYFCIFIFGVLGAARGTDEGLTSITTLPSFIERFGLANPAKTEDELANLKSNIKSMVQVGSILGAIIATYLVDKLGRVRTVQFCCFFWIIGAIIQITSKNVGQLYAGRFIEGALAVGITVACGPAYVSEVTPKAIRGMANCIFAGAVYLGIMLGYFATYGSALHLSNDSDTQWRAPLSLKIILSGLIFIGSFFTIESPRWYIKVGKNEKAVVALSKLRNLPETDPFIIGEITDITEAVEIESAAKKNNNLFGLLVQLFTKKSLIYRFFFLGFACQVLGQWSGANSVTIYASELFAMSGIKGIETLKMTAVLGVVKFVAAYSGAFFIIDFLGRRKSIYIGISIQMISLLYFAIFLKCVPEAAEEGVTVTGAKFRASQGAMAAIYFAGVGWVIGFNALQYLVGAEVFPLHIRTFAQAIIMVVHFANQYGNSKAVPDMLISMTNYGTFFFFVGVNILSLCWAWFCLPEVSGRSLESMEELFNLPWHLIGRKGAELCPDHSEVNRMNYDHGKLAYVDNGKASDLFVENASRRDSEEKEDDI